MVSDLKKIAQKFAWALAEASNAAMAVKAKADVETFLPVIQEIQKQTLQSRAPDPLIAEMREVLQFYAGGLHYTEFFESIQGGPITNKTTIINDRGERAQAQLAKLPAAGEL